MKSQIIENAISKDILEKLLNYYESRPYVEIELGIKNKFLEYHIQSDISYQLLYNSIEKILPNHAFDTGSFKESSIPYKLHVDSYNQHSKIGTTLGLDNRFDFISYNSAMLIPLVEDINLKTITFDIFSDESVTSYKSHVALANNLINDDISHHTIAKFLPVDKVFTWKLGNVFVWPRNQLHMSNNFVKFHLIKKFLIFFFK